ncbi:hypothetical protein D047_3952B, partial [Vibrio parahaemolyticus VPTS-2010_2]
KIVVIALESETEEKV